MHSSWSIHCWILSSSFLTFQNSCHFLYCLILLHSNTFTCMHRYVYQFPLPSLLHECDPEVRVEFPPRDIAFLPADICILPPKVPAVALDMFLFASGTLLRSLFCSPVYFLNIHEVYRSIDPVTDTS